MSRAPNTNNPRYELSEEEYFEEVQRAGQRRLGVIPPVGSYLGEVIPAGENCVPRALNRQIHVEECDTLRNQLCPSYGMCLDAAHDALRKPKRRPYKEAVTFICDSTCPMREDQTVSSLGQFTQEFLAFIQSDRKALPPRG